MPSPGSSPLPYLPVVVISDAHLGMPGVKAAMLAEFLGHVNCGTLIIDGDFIDGLRLQRGRTGKKFPEMHARVLDTLNRRIAEGMQVCYIPGNHDAALRRGDVLGKTILGMTFTDALAFTDPRGRRLIALHGDQFTMTLRNRFMHRATLRLYDAAATANSAADRAAFRLTGRHISPLSRLRTRGDPLIRLTENFRAAVLDYAAAQQADGIIAGHIHVPALQQTARGLYANAGDWVDNCTALGMDAAGDWSLIHWPTRRLEAGLGALPTAKSPNPDSAFRPQTERLLAHIAGLWPGRRPPGPR